MISSVRLRYFKQFEEQNFELSEHVVLAGPNNSGKSTLLQAIAVWFLALQRWRSERSPTARGRKRSAIPITRKDFTAVPLREMNLLWTNTSTALRKAETEDGKAGHPRLAEIALEGRTNGQRWELPFLFRYQSAEQIYVKPADPFLDELPEDVADVNVVHVPPFSGIGVQETRYDRPYQDLLIGQGKPGDLLRNLLLEVHQIEGDAWVRLCDQVKEVFHYQLLPPEYAGSPYIRCEYLSGVDSGLPRLDVSCAGSGFHQVLLLLAFFYARPATILLLDEPDAHEHIVLQKQIYDMLRRIAAERHCQLVIATHSEVLINNTGEDQILSFYKKPHRLVDPLEREQLAEALKRLPAVDLVLAERSPGVLYVEGETDLSLLRAWAKVLHHPLDVWFRENPFWHSNQGRHPREARGHFFALRAINREIKGFLLLDGDNRDLPPREVDADGLVIERWSRYETESYLVHPAALTRFVAGRLGGPIFAVPAEDYLKDQLPPAVYRNPLAEHDYLLSTRASKTFLPDFFRAAGVEISKQEYYLLAEKMAPEEIPEEVREKLDRIAEAFGIVDTG